jgi:hypothetical protein
VGIEPALGQQLPRREDQFGFNKSLGLLQLFTSVQTTLHAGSKGVKQLRQAQHLHDRAIGAGSQEHEAWDEGAPGLHKGAKHSEVLTAADRWRFNRGADPEGAEGCSGDQG